MIFDSRNYHYFKEHSVSVAVYYKSYGRTVRGFDFTLKFDKSLSKERYQPMIEDLRMTKTSMLISFRTNMDGARVS